MVLSVTALIEGLNCLIENGFENDSRDMLTGALYIITGAALLIGFLAPVFCLLFLLGVVFNLCIMLSTHCCKHLWCHLPGIYAVMISVSLAIFGSGTFSLDARFFGKREIITPDDSPHSKT